MPSAHVAQSVGASLVRTRSAVKSARGLHIYKHQTVKVNGQRTVPKTKPHVSVGTIGHVDHGKTTLTTAILHAQANKGLAEVKSYADIARGTVRDASKIVTIAVSHVEYETDNRHYAHVDCPGHADFVKNMITGANKWMARFCCGCNHRTYATNS